MIEDHPEPPAGWTVSTATATHISLYYADADGRSMVVRPTDPPDTEAWTVKGLAAYGPPYPVFADGVARGDALDEAIAVMEAVAAGESVEPVRTETTADSDAAADDSGDSDVPAESRNDHSDEEPDESVDQADLTAFASDGDGPE